jgi:peptide/nickel transport system permease protein
MSRIPVPETGRSTSTPLDILLPGISALVAGRSSGLVILGSWLTLLALTWLRRARILDLLTRPGWDGILALVSLILLLGAAWLAGNRGRFGSDAAPGAKTSRSPGSLAGRRFRRHRQAVLGSTLLAGLTVVTLLTPILAPFDPDLVNLSTGRLLAPSVQHWMGTDQLGRDLLSRVLYGARISLTIGFLAVLIAITLGTTIGAVAGYAGGWIDVILMRIVDLFLSFPRIVLLITVVAVFHPSIPLIVVLLGLTGWMGVSRLVRGQVLSVREREYVQAAHALGYGPIRVLGRHILPNVLTPVIVAATLGIGNAILAEAALSYLGLGVQPPTASWGSIIQSGSGRLLDAWWISTFPGLAIVLTVMSFNLVGDGLRDAFDPRHVE